jgi:hypothetical protein
MWLYKWLVGNYDPFKQSMTKGFLGKLLELNAIVMDILNT